MEYEKLLERGKKNLPDVISSKSRFEIPKVKGFIQGNKTIINNFSAIASEFHRNPQHLLKYLQRELAAPAGIDGPRLILGRKLSSAFINSKIERYARDFVLCKDCGKPDTKLIKEGKFLYMKCMACGAKHVVRVKI
jgi:translation initiation factor 2 subunit 2